MVSRRVVYGSPEVIAISTEVMTSPAPTPRAVKPRMRSLSTSTRAFRNLRVRSAAGCHQHMTALERFCESVLLDKHCYRLAGLPGDAIDPCVQNEIDTFFFQKHLKSFRHIVVFPIQKPLIAMDHRHLAAKTAHCLGKLQSYISAPQDEKMLGNFVQLQCFDMCEGFCVSKAGDWFDRCACARIDDHIAGAKLTCTPVSKFRFERFGTDKASRAKDEFRAGLPIVLEINVVPAGYHSAFAFTNNAHVHREVSFGHAELFASAEIRGHLGAVNDILTGQASDVRARATDVFALDHRHTLPLRSKSPRGDRPSCAATKNHEIEFF